MATVKQWVLLDPLDTLFFKGSESMVAGVDHEVHSIFPPMPSTLTGALVTAILGQRGIPPEDYTGGPSEEIKTKFSLLGEPRSPRFKILGPVFRTELPNDQSQWLYPAPAHWFANAEPLESVTDGQAIQIRVAAEPPPALSHLGLCGSVGQPIWILYPPARDMKSLAGFWTNGAAFMALKNGSGEVKLHSTFKDVDPKDPVVLPLNSLFGWEVRVGIALENLTRKARRGHLYTATQVRLEPGVTLAVGLSEALSPDYLDSQGVLTLGGEQRLARYEFLSEGPELPHGDGTWLMALSPFSYEQLCENNWEAVPRVSGPLIRIAGWDMKKKFHKPVTSYLPAGTALKIGEGDEIPFGFVRL